MGILLGVPFAKGALRRVTAALLEYTPVARVAEMLMYECFLRSNPTRT